MGNIQRPLSVEDGAIRSILSFVILGSQKRPTPIEQFNDSLKKTIVFCPLWDSQRILLHDQDEADRYLTECGFQGSFHLQHAVPGENNGFPIYSDQYVLKIVAIKDNHKRIADAFREIYGFKQSSNTDFRVFPFTSEIVIRTQHPDDKKFPQDFLMVVIDDDEKRKLLVSNDLGGHSFPLVVKWLTDNVPLGVINDPNNYFEGGDVFYFSGKLITGTRPYLRLNVLQDITRNAIRVNCIRTDSVCKDGYRPMVHIDLYIQPVYSNGTHHWFFYSYADMAYQNTTNYESGDYTILQLKIELLNDQIVDCINCIKREFGDSNCTFIRLPLPLRDIWNHTYILGVCAYINGQIEIKDNEIKLHTYAYHLNKSITDTIMNKGAVESALKVVKNTKVDGKAIVIEDYEYNGSNTSLIFSGLHCSTLVLDRS